MSDKPEPFRGKIFISYRRADASGYAGRLFDRLSARFGEENIFMDVEGLDLGVDFVEAIENAVSSCDVLIALIGQQWLNIEDEKGQRRLDNPEDFVRIEIAAALERDILVIPVLVQGARMPDSRDLPLGLQNLSRRNALEIRHERFNADTDRLARDIGKYIYLKEEAKPIPIWANQYAVIPLERLGQLRQRMLRTKSARELKRIKYELQQILVDFPNYPDVLELQDDLEQALAYHTFWGRSKTFVRQYAGAIGMVVVIMAIIIAVLQTRIDSIFDTITGAFPYFHASTETPTFTATITPTNSRTPTPTPWPPDYVDDFGVSMILVPAGAFMMGFDADQAFAFCEQYYHGDEGCDRDWYTNEEPIHQVTLDDYYIDQYEVTNRQYAVCVTAGSCDPPTEIGSHTRSQYYDNPLFDDYPVINVNWEEAQNYCEWRDTRLPTEAEWEKAARGDDERMFPWGDDVSGERANFCDENCEFSKSGNAFDDGFADTAPVGSYLSGVSPYGVYDMAGNVFEWVADRYSPDYYATISSRFHNPTGPKKGEYRVLRGGSWRNNVINIRSSVRFYPLPAERANFVGFRCARLVKPIATPTPVATDTQSLTDTPTRTPTYTPSPTLVELPKLITNDYGVSMALVPAGPFQMGNDADDALVECQKYESDCQREWFEDAEPIRTVSLSDFYINQYEITTEQFAIFLSDQGNQNEGGIPWYDTQNLPRIHYTGENWEAYEGYTDHPVSGVSWFGARAYCEWAGGRLPTEAEWEKAARGGLENKKYPWGDIFDGALVNFCDELCGYNWRNMDFRDEYHFAAPVGSYEPNGYDLYDMVGNVWEWLADWYASDYYENSSSIDPKGPADGYSRVIRGGSWRSEVSGLQVTRRGWSSISNFRRYYNTGFRCARDTP